MADPEDSNLKEIELLKVELLRAQQTISKLQLRSDDMKGEKEKLVSKINNLESQAKKDKEDMEDVISLLKDDIATLTKKKIGLEADLSQKGIELEEAKMAAKAKIERLLADWESERNMANERYKSLEEKYTLIEHFEEEKAYLEERVSTLEEQVEKEIADKLMAIADKEREKVEMGERLKKEMEAKIHETKTTLLALKKEQLDAASRLAVVQNHQLTTELEFQNRQIEKIVAKQTKLEEENARLKMEVKVHKEVENEMAKKTSKAQNIIKKLNERIKELEVEVQELQNGSTSNKDAKKNSDSDKKKDEIIKFLENSLNATEKKLAKDYEILMREFGNLEAKLDYERERFEDAATLVREALEHVMEGENNKSINASESANLLAIDLEEMKGLVITRRGNKIADLDSMQKQMLLNVILEQIKARLNEKNLANDFYPVLNNRANSYGVLMVDKKAYQLPNIHEKTLIHKINKSKFDYTPRSVKSKILKGDLRDWGRLIPDVSPDV